MQSSSTKSTLSKTVLALLVGLQLGATTASAASRSISGNWTGSGVIGFNSGDQERVRCRATFQRVFEKIFSVNARCVGGFGQIDQYGELSRIGRNRYVGSVYNDQYNLSADVNITVKGSRQSVNITSSQGWSSLNLRRR